MWHQAGQCRYDEQKCGEEKGGREKQSGSRAGKEAALKGEGGDEQADVGGLLATQGHEDDYQRPWLGP